MQAVMIVALIVVGVCYVTDRCCLSDERKQELDAFKVKEAPNG
jgi:hypothetical protein